MKLSLKLLFTYSAFVLLGTLSACDSAGGGSSRGNTNDTTQTSENAESEASPQVTIDFYRTAQANILGAMPVENAPEWDSLMNTDWMKQHYQQFEQAWKPLEDARLSKMREWRGQYLQDFNKKENTLFYPFSGPDFLNVYEFFPNCSNYMMFGLEPAGKLTPIEEYTPTYVGQIRGALAEIFQRNYFITSYMGGDLAGIGVFPIIEAFLARTNNEIVKTERFYLDADGKPQFFALEEEGEAGRIEGIMIEFKNKSKEYSQKLYYIGTNVVEEEIKKKPELIAFIKSFPNKYTFVKSASYLLHGGEFVTMRDLILAETNAVLQDDTGIRYDVYQKEGWEVQLFGKYARPIADFGGYTYQPVLAQAFQTEEVLPLDFTYGYHWKTDNTSVLLAKKK